MTFYAFLQKTSIWALSLVPFAIVTCVYMPAVGPQVSVGSLLAIFHCMSVLVGCMYLAERWGAFWRAEDAADRMATQERQARVAAQTGATRTTYSLANLMAKTDFSKVERDDAWLNSAPVGREML